jgi:hypothetical protein
MCQIELNKKEQIQLFRFTLRFKITFGNHKNSGFSKVKINSSKTKFDSMADDQKYLKFFWPLIIQALLEKSGILNRRILFRALVDINTFLTNGNILDEKW